MDDLREGLLLSGGPLAWYPYGDQGQEFFSFGNSQEFFELSLSGLGVSLQPAGAVSEGGAGDEDVLDGGRAVLQPEL